jgi:hypothetical protein
MNPLHDLMANSYGFFLSRNRNHLSKHNSRSLSIHGLHILPHPDSGRRHFLDFFMRFPRLPLPPANCFSLEVLDTAPSLQEMIYM